MYVPREGWSSVRILAKDGPEAFRSEVERLCHLGSPWAAALLGHLHLSTGASGTAKAIEVCKSAANGGSAYAQYVLAWSLAYAGNQSQALHYLGLASLQKFAPATVDLAQFVCRGMGTSAPDPRSAVGLLWLAFRRGHRAALGRICYIYRREEMGFARRFFGHLIAPIAMLWYVVSVSINPFNVNVYLIACRDGKSILRSKT